jgi:hypothetical protein
MGSAAVIFVLLVVVAVLAFEWRSLANKSKPMADQCESWKDKAEYWADQAKRIPILEDEIVRLRKIPLTQPTEKDDTSVIRAKSPADVRRITEAAWGKKPEMEEVNDEQ